MTADSIRVTNGKAILAVAAVFALALVTEPVSAKEKSGFLKGSIGSNSDLPEIARTGTKQARLMAIVKCGASRFSFCTRALIENLLDPDIDIRKSSAQFLGVIGEDIADKPLKKAIQEEKDVNVKSAMILALGYIRSADSATFLYDYLKDNEDKIRRVTANALGVIGNENSLLPLKDRLKEEKLERNKVEILRSIVRMENKREHREKLVELLRSSDDWVRYYAADAIIELRIREAQQPLEDALQIEGNEVVREMLYKAYMKSLYRDLED